MSENHKKEDLENQKSSKTIEKELSEKPNTDQEIKEKTPEEKLKETEEKLLRSLAEIENQRRRFEKEIKDAFEFGSFNFAKESLAILDNLTRAKDSIKNDDKLDALFKSLKEINSKLWDIEDDKRLCEKNSDFTEKFIKLSRDVHFLNDDRAKIKLEMNEHTGSKIKEIKEYTKYN